MLRFFPGKEAMPDMIIHQLRYAKQELPGVPTKYLLLSRQCFISRAHDTRARRGRYLYFMAGGYLWGCNGDCGQPEAHKHREQMSDVPFKRGKEEGKVSIFCIYRGYMY